MLAITVAESGAVRGGRERNLSIRPKVPCILRDAHFEA